MHAVCTTYGHLECSVPCTAAYISASTSRTRSACHGHIRDSTLWTHTAAVRPSRRVLPSNTSPPAPPCCSNLQLHKHTGNNKYAMHATVDKWSEHSRHPPLSLLWSLPIGRGAHRIPADSWIHFGAFRIAISRPLVPMPPTASPFTATSSELVRLVWVIAADLTVHLPHTPLTHRTTLSKAPEYGQTTMRTASIAE